MAPCKGILIATLYIMNGTFLSQIVSQASEDGLGKVRLDIFIFIIGDSYNY